MNDELLFRDECYAIIGACIAVHKDKGNGFAEPVYQDALEIELELSGIPFDAQRNYIIHYRGRPLRHTYTPDLLCFDKIIVELKAAKCLLDEHRAQVLNYLKVTGHQLGLLVNFGSPCAPRMGAHRPHSPMTFALLRALRGSLPRFPS